MSIQQSLEQKRAVKAWEFVEKISKEPDDVKKKYSSLARKVPAVIRTGRAGGGQNLTQKLCLVV
jgi:CRISPR/Cas system CMR-associated protein Cmr5 small subunit